MVSQKSLVLIVSSLLLSALVGVSAGTAVIGPEETYVRQSCVPTNSTDTLDCSFYFDAKKHSSSPGLSNCLVFGYYKEPPSSESKQSCSLKLPANACIQTDLSWLTECFDVYYADTYYLRRRRNNSFTPRILKDNIKIGY
ncbi:hypothetical protein MUCCIDRAFT_163265 [Mucor lusitanicus CBS 277.49]|uniref:Uncharacterized protein n=1 Tax=Mucor lusitanicus CBS 277.49 TaxID=747725 RepID=A0A168LM87_MUCCL|nr:hypothetical protein MUCCIDRAFT_163265 [Mucor lusitanicus CBS 277.49]